MRLVLGGNCESVVVSCRRPRNKEGKILEKDPDSFALTLCFRVAVAQGIDPHGESSPHWVRFGSRAPNPDSLAPGWGPLTGHTPCEKAGSRAPWLACRKSAHSAVAIPGYLRHLARGDVDFERTVTPNFRFPVFN